LKTDFFYFVPQPQGGNKKNLTGFCQLADQGKTDKFFELKHHVTKQNYIELHFFVTTTAK
jgi:hypothetical protein